MKKALFLSLLIIAPLLTLSGCISGDENIDAWNSQIGTINSYLDTANSMQSEINDALDQGHYDLAISKINDAISKYQTALNEIIKLGPIAQDLDKDFLNDYVDVWQLQTNKVIESIEYLKKMVYTEQFSIELDNLILIFSGADQQYVDAVGYFNNGNYAACVSTAELAKQKYNMMAGYADKMSELSLLINIDYVKQYASYCVSMIENADISLDNLMLSANAAYVSDWDNANYYLGLQNTYNSAYNADYDKIIGIENTYPEDFPAQGKALQSLYNLYFSKKEQAEQAAASYANTMNNIEEENSDFFEE